MDEDEFEPKLGRIRTVGSKRARKYLHRVLAAAALAGGPRLSRGRRFSGQRIGRGAAPGRLLGSRDHPALRGRRAIVKTRLVRLGAKGMAAARAHLRYVQRDGVRHDGLPGELYSAREDRTDGRDFLDRCGGDRHQFRLIVSAEDGAQYDDLKPLVRRWMARMEQDLGTRLDWVAVDHRDTGHPHSHVILRGVDDQGRNLVIAREYIARGMRERLAELVTLDLGPRSGLEIARKLRLEIGEERLTALDRRLVREGGIAGIVAAGEPDPFRHALRSGRLKKLEALGLAEDLGCGRWRLAPRFEERLRAVGERGDIVRTMQRAMTAQGLERPAADRVAHAGAPDGALAGRLVATGLSDELSDSRYLIIDGLDGRIHHVVVGDSADPVSVGAIVRLSPARPSLRPADRIVAEVAAAGGGSYSSGLHLARDPSASEEFVQAHVRRLEAMRRAGFALRLDDGSWAIGPDHLEAAAAFEVAMASRKPVRVEILSALPLDRLVEGEGATWLDRELVSVTPEPMRDCGFGKEARAALAARKRWLVAEGLAVEGSEGADFPPDLLATLRRRELLRVATIVSDELGVPYRETDVGTRFSGRLRRAVDLMSGKFALVADEREFTLVPWRPSMERRVGQELELKAGGEGLSWSLARGRRGPEIG